MEKWKEKDLTIKCINVASPHVFIIGSTKSADSIGNQGEIVRKGMDIFLKTPFKIQKEFWIEGRWYYGQNHNLHWQIPEHHFHITAGSLQLPHSLANSHSSAQAMSCFSDSPCFTIINTKGKKTKESKNERKETGKGQTAY